jgi:hypothetical protein
LKATTLQGKLKDLFPSSKEIVKKILFPFIIISSSLALYVCGYLFLWGYYLAGNSDLSLLSVLLNYVPINKTIVSSIGGVYFLLILFFTFLLLSLKEKLNETVLSLLFVSIIVNAAITYFIFNEVNLINFLQSLLFWIFPLIISIMISYYSYYIKYTKLAIVYGFAYFLFVFNIVMTLTYYNFKYIEIYLLFLMLGYFISTTVVLYLNSQITNLLVRKISLILLCIICVTPTSFLILREKIDNILLTSLMYVLSILILLVVFTLILKLKKKNDTIVKTSNTTTITPLIRTNPKGFIAFLIAFVIILLFVVPYSVFKSGEVIRDISGKRHYDTIKYIINKKEEEMKGVILTKENNTYYISTPDQKLVILNSSEVYVKKK